MSTALTQEKPNEVRMQNENVPGALDEDDVWGDVEDVSE